MNIGTSKLVTIKVKTAGTKKGEIKHKKDTLTICSNDFNEELEQFMSKIVEIVNLYHPLSTFMEIMSPTIKQQNLRIDPHLGDKGLDIHINIKDLITDSKLVTRQDEVSNKL